MTARTTAADLAVQAPDEMPFVNLCEERFEPRCLDVLSAREAWEHLVLPMREEGGTLLLAAARETLPEAMELVRGRAATPVRFVLSEIRPLEQFIAELYGFEGIEVDEEPAAVNG